ncbi:hypothetical protein DT075_09645 [Bacillus licheniformis]|nr:hypothetical protein DT075_09645 [Bacillus licheniformis]
MLQHFLIKDQLPDPLFTEADIHFKVHRVPLPKTMEGASFQEVNIHFIRGHAADDATLQKANIEEAEIVFITADQHKSEISADMQSVLTLLAVKGLNPSVYCVVEILTVATMATAAFSKQQRYAEGKVNYRGKGHMILIGWNEKSNKLMRTLQAADSNKTIVLIDETLKEGPLMDLLILLFGQLITFVEPQQFSNVFEGIWWALITVSSVGYGDFVPKTALGKIVGMLLILIGAAFVTAY